ncbi:SRPBCC domain-containing protein [Phyllobacterium salinisoli]|uniref:SRPBCC domain-containing protein n=1 Tax=Phyllobacterium salinisoli TaxID=1899321 RepID=A0A368JZD4_9HYPH|nr:SRPBCC domain-containing protein [Phyllobacterium salinisoli]RCS21785.1 SRPBCC domain-containing protein [Phyllobacterium salinisoli]
MTKETQSKQVLVEVTISAPVATVWRALREPMQLANWFGWDAPGLADEIDYIFHSHATVDEAAHTIQFEPWEGVSDSFELIEHGGATVLRVVRHGGLPIDWKDTYHDINEGWVTFVQQLRLLLDRHPGNKRRTIYLSGAAAPGVPKVSSALGLRILRNKPDGSEFAAELPPGVAVTGTIWHRTHFQLGLGVRQWGDGLLVVTDKGPGEKRPHGGGSVLITTFGLDDGAFAALEARWSGWWAERYSETK